MKYLLSSILFILTLATICFANNKNERLQPNNKYDITFPFNWEVKRNYMGCDIIAISPLEDDRDIFRENVNLIIEELPYSMSLIEYYVINIINMESRFPGFEILESNDIVINNNKAKRIIFINVTDRYNFKYLQYYFCTEKYGYVLTFTALTISYEDYSNKFEEIVKTFHIYK